MPLNRVSYNPFKPLRHSSLHPLTTHSSLAKPTLLPYLHDLRPARQNLRRRSPWYHDIILKNASRRKNLYRRRWLEGRPCGRIVRRRGRRVWGRERRWWFWRQDSKWKYYFFSAEMGSTHDFRLATSTLPPFREASLMVFFFIGGCFLSRKSPDYSLTSMSDIPTFVFHIMTWPDMDVTHAFYSFYI